MNHLRLSTNSALIGLMVAIGSGLGGCASNCSTNPGEMSRLCGASYQLGMNKKLEQHLIERQAAVDEMKQEAALMQTRLAESESHLAAAELKLQAVVAKTEGAREDARRLAGELALKRMDIETKQTELASLEARLQSLRDSKSDKQEHVLALTQTRNEIAQTKNEVESLTQYLEDDLLIRAENALAYD